MDDCYGGTNAFLRTVGVYKWKIDVTFCDLAKINEKNIDSIEKIFFKENTKLILMESCTNPLLKCTYLFDIAKKAKSINPNIIIAIDNTFLTPLICQPLSDSNIDLVFHSGCYFNGNNDSNIGVISTNDDKL